MKKNLIFIKIEKCINRKKEGIAYLNLKELRSLYKKCGIGLIMFNNVGQYYMSYSLKLFEYISSGLAVIASDVKANKLFYENRSIAFTFRFPILWLVFLSQ